MSQFAEDRAAPRHQPVAWGPTDAKEEARRREAEALRESEPKLQVTIAPKRARDDNDPYADVPCTD